jgi:hypothetical protein
MFKMVIQSHHIPCSSIFSSKDLVVDQRADRIQHAGGFISVNTSGNTRHNSINKQDADDAFDAATLDSACVASCKILLLCYCFN